MENNLWFGSRVQRQLIRELIEEKLADPALPPNQRDKLEHLRKAADDAVPFAGVGTVFFPDTPLYSWNPENITEFNNLFQEEIDKAVDHSDSLDQAIRHMAHSDFGSLAGFRGLGYRVLLLPVYALHHQSLTSGQPSLDLLTLKLSTKVAARWHLAKKTDQNSKVS